MKNINNKTNLFENVTSLKGLFSAWNEFKQGKENKLDVQKFFLQLENNIFALWRKIKDGNYQHSKYASFYICDPKLRNINKARVIDRVLHHSIVSNIEGLFDRSFIFDSYSSRSGKGTHRAILRLRSFILKITKNNTKTAWALKCDIKKFFDSIDHDILIDLIREKINDDNLMNIIEKIIRSYKKETGNGIPLGNLTSQLFSNVYLSGFDHYVKRVLKIKYYVRYADDFVILDYDRQKLKSLAVILGKFLDENLQLKIHPNKIIIRKLHQGIDFLGYVIFPTHIVLRTKTKRRIFRKIIRRKNELERGLIDEKTFNQIIQSYFGILKHCNGHEIEKEIIKNCFK
jgi:retron-type reverse transcriptase